MKLKKMNSDRTVLSTFLAYCTTNATFLLLSPYSFFNIGLKLLYFDS